LKKSLNIIKRYSRDYTLLAHLFRRALFPLKGVPVSQEIQFGDSSKQRLTVRTTFLLWDPYTPFFTFEKLDQEMSNKALQELSKLAAGYTKQEFEKNVDVVKQKCLESLNQFGKEYGIEFTSLDITE